MSGSTKFWIAVGTGLLTVVLVALLNLALANTGMQADLTDDKRYTLPEAAKEIAAKIEDVCTVTCYLSDPLPSYLRHLPVVLKTRLEEFRVASKEKLEFQFVVPEGDDDLVADLNERKMEPLTLQDRQEGKVLAGSYYLWMVFRYGPEEQNYSLVQGLQRAILSESETSQILPFQIAAQLVKLMNPNLKIGIASEKVQPQAQLAQSLQRMGVTGQTDGLITLRTRIESHFPKIQDVTLQGGLQIPDTIDTLLVYQPSKLDERAVFELDQFLLRGKRVILLLDNYQAFDATNPQQALAGLQNGTLGIKPLEPGLKPWLKHNGILLEDGWVEDRSHFKRTTSGLVPVRSANGRVTLTAQHTTADVPAFPLVAEFSDDKEPSGQFASDSPMFAGLNRMIMILPAALRLDRDAIAAHGNGPDGKPAVQLEELISTSKESWARLPEGNNAQLFSKDGIKPPEKSEWGSRPLVVSVSGSFKSFFAGKERPPRKQPNGEILAEPATPPTQLDQSTSPGQLWVFADGDFASDWGGVLVANVLGNGAQAAAMAVQMSQTGLINVIDSITVGDQLVRIRKPNIVDRSIPEDVLDENAGSIKFWAVFAAPILLVLLGLFWWVVRTGTTRVASPVRALKPATMPLDGSGGRDSSGSGASAPAPAARGKENPS